MKIEIELGNEMENNEQEDNKDSVSKYKPETDAQFNIFRKYLKMKNLTDDYAKFLGNKIKNKDNKPCSKCNEMPCKCEDNMDMMEE